MNTGLAYRECVEITRREAKNFGYGIRLLPRDERVAMSAVYALARRIDDIGDGAAPLSTKLEQLGAVRDQVGLLGSGSVPNGDAVLVALDDACRRFPIPVAAFGELVDGCEMDARGARFATAAELVTYCRLVAGSIGRLTLGVLGSSDPPRATGMADDLGVALQLTNILRDVVEDRAMGRVYLSAEDRERFGVDEGATGPRDALVALIASEADRAATWFATGLRLLPLLDRRGRACVGTMAGIYHRLLGRIAAAPAAVLDARLSLPAWEKGWVAGRSILGRVSDPARRAESGQA